MEIAVFTKGIAEELVKRGYKLNRTTNKAWLFEDSIDLENALNELTEAFIKLS